jgi:IS5 family transposase
MNEWLMDLSSLPGMTIFFEAGFEAMPERTAFVRFRRALITDGFDRTFFEAITAALKARPIRVKTGSLVDATIITSASETDGDGRWVKHKGGAAVQASRPMSVGLSPRPGNPRGH